ncbi:MAG: type II toxin-antitoxin system VapC family toxin [Lachnospiraceae bacterium]|jgi:predicted nucleic-acid-binding protein|nr:type II toxin-antitoxin system VapC family toxin [Lachnospiraceae bacterium]
MVMLDTNMILRYLLNDNEEMALKAENVIKKEQVYVTIEIIAEVVYVLKGVYSVEREEIKESLLAFLKEVVAVEEDVLKIGIETYAKHTLDFPDCILYAYHRVKGYEIKTFDKKLLKLLNRTD